jgi:RNA polymerase sigma-70 factor (ECF subfamily)
VQDKYLWENIKKGSKKDLKQLHDRYFNLLCLYAFKSAQSPEVMEELVSDCFIKLWENRKTIEIETSVKHYILIMLRNSIIDYQRKNKFITISLDNIKEPIDEDFFDEQKVYAVLYSALEKLPEKRRIILELAVFESLSYNKIAEKLYISRNTVKTQISRAYSFLREKITSESFLIVFYILITHSF